MKKLSVIFTAFAIAATVLFGSTFALAQQSDRPTTNCQTDFHNFDYQHKGYVTYHDYMMDAYGPGGHKGVSPSGNSPSHFYSMDNNNNGVVTPNEFCNWR
jgi:hypothetical protein